MRGEGSPHDPVHVLGHDAAGGQSSYVHFLVGVVLDVY